VKKLSYDLVAGAVFDPLVYSAGDIALAGVAGAWGLCICDVFPV